MIEKLKSLLSKISADYADLRYEIKTETKIVFSGHEITEVSSCPADGFVLRVLKKNTLASTTFTREQDFEKALKTALSNAEIMAQNDPVPVGFALVPVIKDKFFPGLEEDPEKIPIEEKIELTRHYNEIPYQVPNIIHTDISYNETIREKCFVNTEGTEIVEKLITTRIAGSIISSDGKTLQTVRVGVGGSNGFAVLRNREEHFLKKAEIASKLLNAVPVKAGIYNVILNQNLAGVFTHEAFGHFSEADLIENNPTMRDRMKIGARLGNDILNIVDDPTIPGQLGFYKYDDEGVAAKPVQLLKNGVLVGRLHSRRTAHAFNEEPNGHCVAEDYRYAPIIRMGTIFIQPRDKSFEELLELLGDGLYLCDAMGGQTSGENFTFAAQYGYVVRNGKITDMLRDINISGNLYETLNNIEAIGNDLKLGEVGGCGKGQLNIRSCYGAPHIIVKNAVIGGV
ncbi:MAG: TldD/PmbA family protein [candidate division WOR-3 bacterium]|nr:TldD/PmbA family protein [candidate division WOR-3 bacterium]